MYAYRHIIIRIIKYANLNDPTTRFENRHFYVHSLTFVYQIAEPAKKVSSVVEYTRRPLKGRILVTTGRKWAWKEVREQ
jgi:BRCT domain type II-containing protein